MKYLNSLVFLGLMVMVAGCQKKEKVEPKKSAQSSAKVVKKEKVGPKKLETKKSVTPKKAVVEKKSVSKKNEHKKADVKKGSSSKYKKSNVVVQSHRYE